MALRELTNTEKITEDINLLTVKEFFMKQARDGIEIGHVFGIIHEVLIEEYNEEQREFKFKIHLAKVLNDYHNYFTVKRMSFLTNFILGTLIKQSNNFRKYDKL